MLCFGKIDGLLILLGYNIFPGCRADFGKLIAHDPVHNSIQLFYPIARLSITFSRMAHIVVALISGTNIVINTAILSDPVSAASG